MGTLNRSDYIRNVDGIVSYCIPYRNLSCKINEAVTIENIGRTIDVLERELKHNKNHKNIQFQSSFRKLLNIYHEVKNKRVGKIIKTDNSYGIYEKFEISYIQE